MNYNDLDMSDVMKIIEEKRLELDAVIEKNGIGENIPLPDEVLQKSCKLDELINIVQRKNFKKKTVYIDFS